MEKYNIEKDIAAYIKKEFDKKYNPTWHCIVGRNFGSYVTHETKHFIYFYLGQVAVLLFKSGWTTTLLILLLSLNCSVEVSKHFHGVGIFILSTVINYHKVICVCVSKHRFVNIYRWARLKTNYYFLCCYNFYMNIL